MAQDYRNSLRLASRYAKSEIRVSALRNAPDLAEEFDKWATLQVSTGDCLVQTHATPAELRVLAAMLTRAANVIDAQASCRRVPAQELAEVAP